MKPQIPTWLPTSGTWNLNLTPDRLPVYTYSFLNPIRKDPESFMAKINRRSSVAVNVAACTSGA